MHYLVPHQRPEDAAETARLRAIAEGKEPPAPPESKAKQKAAAEEARRLTDSGIPRTVIRQDPKNPNGPIQRLDLYPDGSYRELNFRIGRLSDPKGLPVKKLSRRAFLRKRRWQREKHIRGYWGWKDAQAQKESEGLGEGEDEWLEVARKKQEELKAKQREKENKKAKKGGPRKPRKQ